jgi:anti-anti-sigma factor
MPELPQPFFAKRSSNNGRVVIELGGECDLATLDQVNEILREAVAAQPSELVIDLAQATFVDSLSLGALTRAAKQIRSNGGSFQLVRASEPEIKRALAITGLDSKLSPTDPDQDPRVTLGRTGEEKLGGIPIDELGRDRRERVAGGDQRWRRRDRFRRRSGT